MALKTIRTGQLAIATISWARTMEEEQLLKQSLQTLAGAGHPVYITDGGSDDAFIRHLQTIKNVSISRATEKGLVAQVKHSLQQAYHSKTKFIFYTEPDKADFFLQLDDLFSSMDLKEDTGVVLASRSAAGLQSFPPFQVMTETTINNCCAEVMGHNIDYTYGPFIINRAIIPYLLHLPANIGWGWRPYCFNIARRLGYKIDSFSNNYQCPPGQRIDNDSERIYRIKQLHENLQGLVLSTAEHSVDFVL